MDEGQTRGLYKGSGCGGSRRGGLEKLPELSYPIELSVTMGVYNIVSI